MAVPAVSIGLPVYNGEPFLQQTLDDLLGQTFEDFELIVSDNASTDRTEAIVRAAAARDARVVYVRHARNRGALPNANHAFDCARAHRYVLAAADVRHAPVFLEHLVAALDADPGAAVAYGRSTLVGEDGRPFAFDPEAPGYVDAEGRRYPYDASLERPLPGGAVARYRAVLRSTDVNAPIHGLFRRDVLERVGPHQIHGSDRLIVAHAALLGRFAFVDAPLFGYRIHAASTVHLTRDEWMARDTGSPGAGSALDPLWTLRRYLAATANADLGLRDRAWAIRATLGHAVRPQVLRRLVVPGVDNYWGWTRWPWATAPPVERPSGDSLQSRIDPGWNWLAGELSEKEANSLES